MPSARRRPLVALLAAALLLFTPAALGAGPATSDPFATHQWALDRIGAQQAWGAGTGDGIVIAVIDTGVDLTHEDLAPKLVPGRDVLDGDDTPQDCEGHGTLVAGVAAAATDNGRGVAGTAPSARIMPVRVLDCDGQVVLRDTVSEGIRWAVDHGAHVVNLSLGAEIQPLLGGPAFSSAIEYAWSKGVISVVAAPRSDDEESRFTDEPVMVVTATDRHDALAGYAGGVAGARWGMAAPGGADAGGDQDQRLREDVVSTWWRATGSTYGTSAGTSLAAPHVAGAAAVLRGLGLTPPQTVDRLLATAVDLGSSGRDRTYGHGRLDLAAAVQGLGAPPPPPATPAPPSSAPPPAPPATTGATASPPPGGTGGDDGTTSAPTPPAAPSTSTTAASPATTSDDDNDGGTDQTVAIPEVPGSIDGGDGGSSRAVPATLAGVLAAVAAAGAGTELRRRARAGPAGR